MVVRHFEGDSLVFIRETPVDVSSGLPSPFEQKSALTEEAWAGLQAYLSMCEAKGSFDYLTTSKAFSELTAASAGTIQGLLIALAWYIECTANQIYSDSPDKEMAGGGLRPNELSELVEHVEQWQHYAKIQNRLKGLLSMLAKPDTQSFLRDLARRHVIEESHRKAWNRVRPYLMHGGLADFSKNEEFLHLAGHLISMSYRLTLSLLDYRGTVLDYDGSSFHQTEFQWQS
jgi:hypothetical protein